MKIELVVFPHRPASTGKQAPSIRASVAANLPRSCIPRTPFADRLQAMTAIESR
jgi:hypothetical protein